MMVGLLLLLLLELIVGCVGQTPSCLDESGNPTDWWVALKLPNSYSYLIYDSTNFRKSPYGLDIPNRGAIGKTLAGLYQNKTGTGYLMYNDQTPDDANHDSRAHMKGMINFNSRGGFWLIHSVPRYPAKVNDGYFGYPQYAMTYGQSFLCISLSLTEVNKVGLLLQYDWPYIYDSFVPSSLTAKVPLIVSAISGVHTTPAASHVAQVISKAGTNFTAFAKNYNWNNDLYEHLIEPYWESGMLVQSWTNGPGKIPSMCRPTVGYDSKNIDTMTLKGVVSWKSTQDHSKWAVATSVPVACVSDINRQEGQRKRGGGSVCSDDPRLFQAMTTLVENVESC